MEVDFHGYSIDSDGFIWNKRHTAPLAGSINKSGYHHVGLWYDDAFHYFITSRLVAMAFVENDDPEHKTQVNHKDLNKLNNHYTNLEWTTPQENTIHGYKYGRISEAQKKATAAAREVVIKHFEVYKNGELIGVATGKHEAAKMGQCDPKTVYNCIRENRSNRKGYSFREVK